MPWSAGKRKEEKKMILFNNGMGSLRKKERHQLSFIINYLHWQISTRTKDVEGEQNDDSYWWDSFMF